jgi:hypothetical protein
MAATNILPGTRPPIVLSGQITQTTDADKPGDLIIEGVPFLLYPSDQDPYVRQSSEDQRDQFDSSREAGENSLGQWWLRSQATFHGGQGQTYLESAGATEITRTRFSTSRYAYVHTPGQVTRAGTVTSAANTRKGAEIVTWSSVQKLVTMSTSTFQIHVADLPGLTGATTIALGATGVPTAMTTDGSNIHVAIADKIYRVNSSGVATQTHTLTFSGPVAMGFAKQRLIVSVGNKIYELDPNPSVPPVAVTTPIYTNPATDYVYTSIAEGANGIYLAGYSGTKSELSSMSVTESGSTVVLGPPIVQLRMPPGELINDVFFYVSSFFALATSLGVRVGGYTPYGQPQMGRLLMERTPTYTLTGSGTLLWIGAKDSIWWVDLATPIDGNGGYSHSMYVDGVGSTSSDPVSGLVVYTGGSNDLVYGSTNAGWLISQPTWTAATTATLTTSWARFDTVEPKRLFYVSVEGDNPICGVTVETTAGQTLSFTCDGTRAQFEFSTATLNPAQAFRLTFTLTSGTLRSYQLKALPVPQRYKEIVLPLMCFDSEDDMIGELRGYGGFAKDRLVAMETLAESNTRITVKDNILGTSYQAMIRRLQFRQTLNPTREDGIGGILNLVLRLV